MEGDENEEGLSERRHPILKDDIQKEYTSGYDIGVSNGHSPFQFLSDGGAHPPERCYQTLFFSIAVYFLFHTFLIRQQLFLESYGSHGRSGRCWKFLIYFNFFFSLCCLVGFLFVSSFSDRDSQSSHHAGAMITFLAAILYIWIDLGLSLFRPLMTRRFTRLFRFCVAVFATINLIAHEMTLQAMASLPVVVPPGSDMGDIYTPWKYPPGSPYSANHVVATGTEWAMVISFFIYFLTFVDEFFLTRHDPSSVHASWDAYFRNVEAGAGPGKKFVSPPLVGGTSLPRPTGSLSTSLDKGSSLQTISDHLKVQLLIRGYQTRGHNIADLDPLGINSADLDDTTPPELELSFYGLSDADLDREFFLPPSTFIGTGDEKSLSLREIINRLKRIYCKTTGIEYMHLTNYEQQDWIRKKFERPAVSELSHDQKKVLLKRLIQSTKFEEFLAKKYPNYRRFGLGGCEVLIPAINQIIDASSAAGIDSVVMGMPHRGRINVLANVIGQPLPTILSQFSNLKPADEGSGDLIYHLGACVERLNRQSQRNIKIAVIANPSHLEAVDPVVLGKVRAEAFYSGDKKCDKTMAILMHGDAAFSGQGVVTETFNLGDLHHYTTHGTIHVVVNNQIGFTTDPRVNRSSPYCTDVGRVVGCPIFHVNVDDPEAVMHVCNVAADWRHTFKKDVIIDLVCYRRLGHNESDEPMFTQPLMYQKINQTKPVLDKYQKQITLEGVANDQYVKDELTKYGQILEDAYNNTQKLTFLRNRDWLDSPWNGFFNIRDPLKIPSTGIELSIIDLIIDKFTSVPKGFNLHRGLKGTLKGRRGMVQEDSVDWSIGEALAFGSLLHEGTHVRLSGQDVERGTFSHRHHVLHDQKVDKKVYNPLNHLSDKQAFYSVSNSSLSEYAVLGFELGYSMVNPNSLVIWEAQFGDFSNIAQCIIDQFISSGQSKWNRQTGLVMFLPHGYEGSGPEHSSARPERFLQMCNEDDTIDTSKTAFGGTFEAQQLHDTNWIVANCTTPANIFHLLRRQVTMPFRKPAVVMTPKSLLRHPLARSPISDFLPGTTFQRVIPEQGISDPTQVQRVVFCTGKVYYDLVAARRHVGKESACALVRLEQLSPFPYDLIHEECSRFPGAELFWAQEEHKNMGAWTFVQPRFNSLLSTSTVGRGRTISYAGRLPSASPATGSKYILVQEEKDMFSKILNVEKNKLEGFKV